MRIVPVNLNEKSYNIYIGHNLETTIIDFFKAQLHNATNVAREISFEAPTPCKSSICNK